MADVEPTPGTTPAAPATPAAAPSGGAPASTPPAPAPAAAAPATGADTTDWKAEAEKWQTLSRKHERRQLEALGFDPDQIEAVRAQLEKDPKAIASKTGGYDELAKRLQTLETERNEAVAHAMRSDVATAKGVPVELLTGTTKAELEAAADALLAFKGVIPKVPSANGQGGTGGAVHQGEEMSAEDIVAAATKR